jgi:hypothetical protein
MATIKGNEESRLKQIAAGLGMSGADPSTPGGAMLAYSAAIDANADVANSLTQYGITSDELNREHKATTSALLTDLATKRLGVKSAFLAGDRTAMMQLSDSIGQILEAVRTQKEYETYAADQARDAADQSRHDMYMQAGLNLGSAGIKALLGGM